LEQSVYILQSFLSNRKFFSKTTKKPNNKILDNIGGRPEKCMPINAGQQLAMRLLLKF